MLYEHYFQFFYYNADLGDVQHLKDPHCVLINQSKPEGCDNTQVEICTVTIGLDTCKSLDGITHCQHFQMNTENSCQIIL